MVLLSLTAAAALAAAPAATPARPASSLLSPRILAQNTLSARPEALAQGPAGPINRVAFELSNFRTSDPRAEIACIYPGKVTLPCRTERTATVMPAENEQIIVEIPDIDRGGPVIVRFRTPYGAVDARVELQNRSRVIHEIESVLLTGGGQSTTDGSGRPAPVLQTGTLRATTLPAISMQQNDRVTCGTAQARWLGANATDAVFSSAFGVLTGSIVLARAPLRREWVTTDTAPEWLITFPLGATRVQFIAHYEVEYRVTPCIAPPR